VDVEIATGRSPHLAPANTSAAEPAAIPELDANVVGKVGLVIARNGRVTEFMQDVTAAGIVSLAQFGTLAGVVERLDKAEVVKYELVKHCPLPPISLKTH
jgi:hypothetical protein